MRITCHSVDDFIANLKDRQVYDSTVYVSRTKREIGEGCLEVNYQASAVVLFDDEGQALLQYGENCGKDFETDQEYDGSERQETLHDTLERYCTKHELAIRPGVVDQ